MKKLIFVIAIFLSYQSIAQTGLLAHYTMDGSGIDVSGNGYNATLFGGPSVVADEFGNPTGALSFDGVNDYFTIPVAPFLINNYTYSVCVKATSLPSSNSSRSILSIGDNTADQYILLSDLSSQGLYGFNCGSYFSPGVTPNRISAGVMPSTAVFYHLAVTRSDNTLNFYVNGSLINSVPVSNIAPSFGSNPSAYIGRRTGSVAQYFIGVIEDVKIFNRELSQQEIAGLCNINAGLNDISSGDNFLCFPNPANESISISSKDLSSIKQIEIIDASGKSNYQLNYELISDIINIDIKNLTPGIYFIDAVLNKDQVIHKKFIKTTN